MKRYFDILVGLVVGFGDLYFSKRRPVAVFVGLVVGFVDLYFNKNRPVAGKRRPVAVFVGLVLGLFGGVVDVCGQNVQLHYDFGSGLYGGVYNDRPRVTSTVEMFKADRFGSTFFFIDMDYGRGAVLGSYWEIARELLFFDNPFSLHLEYNGGLALSFPFRNAYLGGVTYTANADDFSRGFTFSAMYKHIQKHAEPHNFQLTATWFAHFGDKRRYSFSGFADFWREKTAFGSFILLAEPQFWVNLNGFSGFADDFNLSVGSEVEISNNFAPDGGFYAIPTLAVKWTFN
ncbi:MAG: DUF5020 family protein [Tannerellaceae bacterium]|jgi:hypothetical protein|nr:DUF5020 family protein [Tannerellaceae bacterium]